MLTIVLTVQTYKSMLSLTVGFCLFVASFAADIQEKFRQLNKYMISFENKDLTIEERNECKKFLKQIIQFHSEARE